MQKAVHSRAEVDGGEVGRKVGLGFAVLFYSFPRPCKYFVGANFSLDRYLLCPYSLPPDGFPLSIHDSLASLQRADLGRE